jgi:RNA recognition motif-containing protein
MGTDYYDFFYMPHDGRAKFSKGYAFINITDSRMAKEFIRRVDGLLLQEKPYKKVQVFEAAEQGVLGNLLTIQHTNWAKKEQFPLVRINGTLKNLTPIAAINELSSSTLCGWVSRTPKGVSLGRP